MTRAKPILSPRMLGRVIVAAFVALAPLRGAAADPDPAALAARAATAAAQAMAEDESGAAAVAAFEAHNLWSQAHKVDGDERHLCAARTLLAKMCARQDLAAEHLASLDRSRDALSYLACARPSRPSGSSQARASSRSIQSRPPTIPVPVSLDRRYPMVQVDLRPEVGTTAGVERRPNLDDITEDPSLRLEPSEPHERGPFDAPLHPRQAFLVGGGVSLGLGIMALGVMTPYAIRDAAYAREIRTITASKDADGRLTPAQDARLAELAGESRSTFRASLALGVSGGLATLLGASLLIAGQRRSHGALVLTPRVGRSSASLSLQGRF